jgi:hypothetical protein
MSVAVAVGGFMLAAILTTAISLQKSFNAVDNYFATQMQQIRIVDYIARDAKRSYVVTATTSPQSITCIIPNYVIASGDKDAGASNEWVGKRRCPTVSSTSSGSYLVSYGSRTVSDVASTNGSTTLTSTNAAFTAADVGLGVTGAGIPAGAKIASYVNATTVTLSSAATATATGATLTFGSASAVVYSISGQSILRTENGELTTIASSTDNLLPTFNDVQLALANTEYVATSITFLPIFATNINSTQQNTERAGTTLYSTAYLRNKRRP